jgi:hypothetical protein
VERALERALFPAHRVREVAHLLAVEQWDGLDPAQVGFPRAPQTRVARACASRSRRTTTPRDAAPLGFGCVDGDGPRVRGGDSSFLEKSVLQIGHDRCLRGRIPRL